MRGSGFTPEDGTRDYLRGNPMPILVTLLIIRLNFSRERERERVSDSLIDPCMMNVKYLREQFTLFLLDFRKHLNIQK